MRIEPRLHCRTFRSSSSARAAVLLEVILALVLFVAAAAVLTASMNMSSESVSRQKLALQADTLASSVLAELQIGARQIGAQNGPVPFEPPFDGWTAEIVVSPTETETGSASDLSRVEVIIRTTNAPIVQRRGMLMKFGTNSASETAPAEQP